MLGLWNPTDCRLEIQRLEFHCGFPSGSNLRCPAFTGDKYEYILAEKPFTIPSFKIPLQVASERQLLYRRKGNIIRSAADILYI